MPCNNLSFLFALFSKSFGPLCFFLIPTRLLASCPCFCFGIVLPNKRLQVVRNRPPMRDSWRAQCGKGWGCTVFLGEMACRASRSAALRIDIELERSMRTGVVTGVVRLKAAAISVLARPNRFGLEGQRLVWIYLSGRCT